MTAHDAYLEATRQEDGLFSLENDGFETTVRIYKYDEKQLPYVETNISIYWCNEFRD